MPKRNLLVMVLVVLTFGIIAAGCGDDDSTSATTVTADDTSVTTSEETTADDTSADTTSSDSGDNPVDADAFYDACIDAVSGTPGEAAGTTGCDQARTALEQCGEQAVASGNDEIADTAIKACQDTADQAVKQLESLGG